MASKLRAAGYVRVSTDEQVDTGSLRAQRRAIEQHAKKQGYTLVRIYADEGVSAHSDQIEKRPALMDLLGGAGRREFDVVIVHTLDRWARNVGVQREALSRLGVAQVGFVSVTEQFDFSTPAGRLMLTMIGGVSEFFSDQLGVHVEKGQRERVRGGQHMGPVPFGYIVVLGGTPTVAPAEAEAVREIFQRRAAGQSNGETAAWLNTQGFRTRTGRVFTAHAVKDMLLCRFYTGVVTYRTDEFAGRHEAIVDEALWERAQRRRAPRRRHRVRAAVEAALRGRVVCSRCGHALHCETNSRGHVMYRERHACECPTNGRAVSAARIDAAVGEYFAALHLPQDFSARIARIACLGHGRGDLEALRDQRRRVARAFADGGLTTAEYEARLREIDVRITATLPESQPDLEAVEGLLRDLRSLWQEATPVERQVLLEPIIERAVVDLDVKALVWIGLVPAAEILVTRP